MVRSGALFVLFLSFLPSPPASVYALHSAARSTSAVHPPTVPARADNHVQKPRKDPAGAEKVLTKEERLAFIRRAQVWAPTDVSTMDLKKGPQGIGAFAPDEVVTCEYVEAKLPGSSRKFKCAIAGDIVKVRYGAANGEVEGSVLATRLLWALGFGADRVYPVRVVCRGCPPDPWTQHLPAAGQQVFDPAVIERKPHGHIMKTERGPGWAWPELGVVDEAQGGAPRGQRDALTLLAVFMQHTDSKRQQQRLVCLPGGLRRDGECDKPFLMVHDVGVTFGHANMQNRAQTGSVNLAKWAETPVWRDARACVGHLSKSSTGTLDNPQIGEAGRALLAHLLSQLRDEQLRDLFQVARVDRREGAWQGSAPAAAATVDAWVSAFKHKREEIVSAHCPS